MSDQSDDAHSDDAQSDDAQSDDARARGRPVPWEPLIVALGAVLLGAGVLLLTGLVGPRAAAVAVVVGAFGCVLVAIHRRSRRMGWANGVTLARLVGTSWLAALATCWLATPASRPAVALAVALALGCLILDGVDGRVARARGESSDFGARFDMETDAAMIMVLCVAVAAQGGVGWWVLAIGLIRYGYWLASLRIAVLTTPITPSIPRKIVAVGQTAALVLCLLLGGSGRRPSWLPSLVAGIALAGLLWSFSSETVYRIRAARHPTG